MTVTNFVGRAWDIVPELGDRSPLVWLLVLLGPLFVALGYALDVVGYPEMSGIAAALGLFFVLFVVATYVAIELLTKFL